MSDMKLAMLPYCAVFVQSVYDLEDIVAYRLWPVLCFFLPLSSVVRVPRLGCVFVSFSLAFGE